MKTKLHMAFAAMLAVCGSCAQATEERLKVSKEEAARAPDQTSENYGDWTVRCVARTDLPPCDMIQVATTTGTNEQVMRFSIAHAGKEETYGVQILVPLGVLVSGGVLVRIDDKTDVDGLKFTRCEAAGCFIEALMGSDKLAPLRRGEKGVVAVLNRNGEPLAMPVSLKGFAAAMDAMAARNRAWQS